MLIRATQQWFSGGQYQWNPFQGAILCGQDVLCHFDGIPAMSTPIIFHQMGNFPPLGRHPIEIDL